MMTRSANANERMDKIQSDHEDLKGEVIRLKEQMNVMDGQIGEIEATLAEILRTLAKMAGEGHSAHEKSTAEGIRDDRQTATSPAAPLAHAAVIKVEGGSVSKVTHPKQPVNRICQDSELTHHKQLVNQICPDSEYILTLQMLHQKPLQFQRQEQMGGMEERLKGIGSGAMAAQGNFRGTMVGATNASIVEYMIKPILVMLKVPEKKGAAAVLTMEGLALYWIAQMRAWKSGILWDEFVHSMEVRFEYCFKSIPPDIYYPIIKNNSQVPFGVSVDCGFSQPKTRAVSRVSALEDYNDLDDNVPCNVVASCPFLEGREPVVAKITYIKSSPPPEPKVSERKSPSHLMSTEKYEVSNFVSDAAILRDRSYGVISPALEEVTAADLSIASVYKHNEIINPLSLFNFGSKVAYKFSSLILESNCIIPENSSSLRQVSTPTISLLKVFHLEHGGHLKPPTSEDTSKKVDTAPFAALNGDGGSFSPEWGMATICVFPKNPSKLIATGEESEIFYGNQGASSINVIAIRASVHLPYDHRYLVQNLTASVAPLPQTTFPYLFFVRKFLQPGAYDLAGTIVYEIDRNPYQSPFYNGTIEVAEVGGILNVGSVFLFCLAIAFLVLFGFSIQIQIQNLSEKTKRLTKVEVGTSIIDCSDCNLEDKVVSKGDGIDTRQAGEIEEERNRVC